MTPALEEALKLLRLAQADRDTFIYLIPAVDLRDASVLFHAQQAIEKAFKAVMTAGNVPFAVLIICWRWQRHCRNSAWKRLILPMKLRH